MLDGSPAASSNRANTAIATAAASTSVDERLLDHVITSLRALSRGARVQYALQVGALLLDSFWSGNADNYRDKQKPAGTGFGALLQERAEDLEDLQLSPSTLRNYIRSTIVWRQLPVAVRERLDLPNLQALTLLPEPGQRLKIAQEAAEGNLNSRQLETRVDQVRKQAQKGATRGRKPVPEPLKQWRRVCRDAIKGDVAKMATIASGLPTKDRAEMRANILAAQSKLAALLALIPVE
jgi:hypothetical protein